MATTPCAARSTAAARSLESASSVVDMREGEETGADDFLIRGALLHLLVVHTRRPSAKRGRRRPPPPGAPSRGYSRAGTRRAARACARAPAPPAAAGARDPLDILGPALPLLPCRKHEGSIVRRDWPAAAH